MEVLIRKQNLALDATIFSTLMSCARLTDFRFNHNLQSIGGKTVPMEMGSIVHKFLEIYYKSIVHGLVKSRAVELGLAAAQLYIIGCPTCNDPEPRACGHQKGEYPGAQNSSPDDTKLAIDTCLEYAEFYRHEQWTPIDVERVKGEVIYEDDEVRILWKAKFDLTVDTNNGIYPVDHKTMKQRRDTLTLNNQFMGQCVLEKTRQMIVNKIGFQTSLKPAEKFLRPVVSYSLDRLMEWSNEIVPFYSKLMLTYAEGGYWPPNFTHCENKYGFCAFKSVCEAPRHLREDELRINFFKGDTWDPKG